MIVESAFTGGESVYCINQMQMRKAVELADKDPSSGPRIREMLREMEGRLNRNEMAAVAFLVLDRLLKEPGTGTIRVAATPSGTTAR